MLVLAGCMAGFFAGVFTSFFAEGFCGPVLTRICKAFEDRGVNDCVDQVSRFLLGVHLVDLTAQVLGHVLRGGASVNEGVHYGGEDSERIEGVGTGGEVKGCGGVT